MSSTGLHIFSAHSFGSRLAGLLARPPLRANEALYIAPCASVHTCFMRYPIDVAFVDRDGRVLKLVEHLKPFKAASCWQAHGAVELAAGGARLHGLEIGTRLPLVVNASSRTSRQSS